MKHQWRRLATGSVFLGLSFLGLWGSQVTWASSNQSPAPQTVPTRGPTATFTPPRVNTAVPTSPVVMQPTAVQPTAVRPTNTPTKTNTPVPGATAIPATSTPVPTQPPPSALAEPAPSAGIIATANENVRIRSAPSTSAAIAGQLKKGDTAQVVGRSAASDWLQIVMPANANARGWISADFATTSSSVSGLPVAGAAPSAPVPVPSSAPPPVVLADTPTSALPTIVLPAATLRPAITLRPTEPLQADTDPSAPSNPWLSIVIGIVMLGLGGGFMLILFGSILTLLARR